MVTKLKNIKANKHLKYIAFLLAIISLTSLLTIFAYLNENTASSFEAAFQKDYLKSNDLKYELNHITNNVERILTRYRSEEYIKGGGTLPKDLDRYYSYSWKLENLYRDFKRNYYKNSSKPYNTVPEKKLIDLFEKEYTEELALYKEEYIQKELNTYDQLQRELKSVKGLSYYISTQLSDAEEFSYTNVSNGNKAFFKSYPVYLLFDKDGTVASPKLKPIHHNLKSYPQDIMYVGLNDTFLKPRVQNWNHDCKLIVKGFSFGSIFMVLFFLSLIYLFLAVGKRDEDGKIHLRALDKLYIDIHILIVIMVVSLLIMIAFESIDLGYYIFIPTSILISALSIYLLLSIAKHIKNKTIFTHNLYYKIPQKIYSYIKKLFSCAPIVLRMIPTPNKATDLKSIIKGIEHIKKGELDYHITTLTTGIYGSLGDDINDIAKGLKSAVDNELKSERLKTELLSNVSHDIRTPLTSIITYVDLLKKEGLDSKKGPQYLEVLDQKSLRLKTLTDDLFEASKASSGDMPVHLEKVEINSLLTQGLVELDEKIVSSGLDFKFQLPKEKIFVRADGKLLWRVLENLLFNIFKYALSNSRVYIDIVDSKNHASIILKNISAQELNIHETELMERFTRGDESRSSEGSGLGLSIAKSLVILQKGDFHIEIDGDLFKATITLPKYE
ncbi:sensor histidine kinase [Crassaminicella profunda]|uniref:sensor histidine kinase n=1 Tax=Crassaminicella profunda TaxID=1286698 RepID=UPI001CA77481|nr:HAMP domain-containing sensor histidine kinase [Crassaminicella profunda]QZY55973.1 HAMP domain-containing histidine kinase [Crassaminicella profunda]